MATTARRLHHTYADYLALEAESPVRHEFLDGEIYAMAGGSPDHAALAAAVIATLAAGLSPDCRVFSSDLRLRVPATGLATYPDAAVVCGPTERDAEDPLAVVNPVLVVEVTSPSTEDYDRGEKLRHYRTIPSLRGALVVSHREPFLTLHRRAEGGTWTTLEAAAGEALRLEGLGVRLEVDDVTKQISFPAEIEVSDDSVTADAEFSIQRFDWDISYKGTQDDLIRDEVVLRLDVQGEPMGGTTAETGSGSAGGESEAPEQG